MMKIGTAVCAGPVRHIPKIDQTSFVKLLKIQIRLHHCVNLLETIKMHIWNGSSAPQSYWSDRFVGAVRPVFAVKSELEVVI